MDGNNFNDSRYLRCYYAGLAMNGLLAEGRLSRSMDGEYGVSEGVNKFAALAFKVADAMVAKATEQAAE